MTRSPLAYAVVAPLVVALALAASACSSSNSSASATNPAQTTTDDAGSGGTDGTDIPANADSALEGEYVASDVGPIDDITFDDDSSYVEWASPCPDTGSCLSMGTFAVSADGTQITLTDGATGTPTTLPYEAITATTDTASLTGQALRPLGLVTSDGGTLVKSVVSTATVGSQSVKLVVPVATLVSSSSSNCTMSLPISGDPSTFLAVATKALAAKKGTISGTTSSGTLSVPGPLAQVNGTYTVMGNAVLLAIAPSSLNFLQSCSKVYSALKAALNS